MATRRVEIVIERPFRPRLSRTHLRQAVLRTLDIAFPGQPCQLGLAICDDETVQRVNRDYRGADEVTDVLAFSSQHPGPWQGQGEPPDNQNASPEPFIFPPGELPYLGEVLISYPQACRQASGPGNSPDREMALLIVHGVLHLLGFDHQKPREKAAMAEMQRKVLAQVLQKVQLHP